MSNVFYEKRGRRYYPTRVDVDRDIITMQTGTFLLIHAYADGGRMFHYEVTPDTAAFFSAAQLAKLDMIQAMESAAPAVPVQPYPVKTEYTAEQLAIIDKFRKDMAKTGALLPAQWTIQTVRDLAEAGVKAVLEKQK